MTHEAYPAAQCVWNIDEFTDGQASSANVDSEDLRDAAVASIRRLKHSILSWRTSSSPATCTGGRGSANRPSSSKRRTREYLLADKCLEVLDKFVLDLDIPGALGDIHGQEQV